MHTAIYLSNETQPCMIPLKIINKDIYNLHTTMSCICEAPAIKIAVDYISMISLAKVTGISE